jgi:hypothetical protein
MKQIGWCIDEMARLTFGKNLPLHLDSNEDYITAKDTLSKVFNVALTLGKLVENENFEKILFRLKGKNLNGREFKRKHIKKVFNDLQSAVIDLERYLIALSNLLDTGKYELWLNQKPELLMLLNTRFTLNYYELRDEFNVPLHTKNELKKLGIFNEHLKYFLD